MKLKVLRIARWVFWVLLIVSWTAEGLELTEEARSVFALVRAFVLLAGFACGYEEAVLLVEDPDARGVRQLKIACWLAVGSFVVFAAATVMMLIPGTSRAIVLVLHGIGLLLMLPPIITVEVLRRSSKK